MEGLVLLVFPGGAVRSWVPGTQALEEIKSVSDGYEIRAVDPSGVLCVENQSLGLLSVINPVDQSWRKIPAAPTPDPSPDRAVLTHGIMVNKSEFTYVSGANAYNSASNSWSAASHVVDCRSKLASELEKTTRISQGMFFSNRLYNPKSDKSYVLPEFRMWQYGFARYFRGMNGELMVFVYHNPRDDVYEDEWADLEGQLDIEMFLSDGVNDGVEIFEWDEVKAIWKRAAPRFKLPKLGDVCVYLTHSAALPSGGEGCGIMAVQMKNRLISYDFIKGEWSYLDTDFQAWECSLFCFKPRQGIKDLMLAPPAPLKSRKRKTKPKFEAASSIVSAKRVKVNG